MKSSSMHDGRIRNPNRITGVFSFGDTVLSYVTVSLLALMPIIFYSCVQQETAKPAIYDGPQQEAENVEIFYTEKGLMKVRITAKKVLQFQSGDREFPEGIYLEFFNESGKITSTLKANHANFFSKEDQWRGRGDVEVKNIEKNEQLNTEELFWKPKTKRIFTEKFVTIRQQKDILYGTGLEAAQDLSDYKIGKPEAEWEIEEDQ